MNKPLVSIIILNFNGLTDTVKCLKSIKKTTYPNFEILLLDNGSDNNEGLVLQKKYGQRYKVILLNKNLGFTGGNNLALKKAKGKYIILLNNDTEVTPNWIEPLVTLLNKDKSIAIVQPKIKMLQNKNYFDYAGAAGGFIDKYGYPFTRGRIFETKEKDAGQYDNEGIIFWASGASCIIRKSTIKKVGGLFDPTFFNYMEEIDFCWRIWKGGYKVYYCPNSVIYHKGAASTGKNLFKKRYWEHRNNLILLYKNLGRIAFCKTLVIRILLECATYLNYLLKGNFTYLKSLFLAHVDFASMIIRKELKRNTEKHTSNQRIPVFPSSIALYYYVFKREVFNNLEWSPKGNVSIVIFNTNPSGGLKLILSQANDLISIGYHVNIYNIFGSAINWMPTKATKKTIVNYFLNFVPDIIIFTFWPTSYLYKFFSSKNKYYLVMDSKLFYKNRLLKTLVTHSFTLPLNYIAISTFLKKEIEKNNPKNRVQIIDTVSVDYNQFIYYKPKNLNPYKRKKIKILSVMSNYEYYKGIDLLTETVNELKKINRDYHFTLVSWEKYKYDNVFDRFFSNPSRKRLTTLYRQSDVLLVTSRAEGFFIPGLEAMASSCIVISTNSFGILEYAKNNHNAVIVNNYEDIWKKNVIDNTLKNTGLSQRIIQNGHKTVDSYISKNKTKNLAEIIFPDGQ